MTKNFIIIPSNSDLQHHGILGMKWGIRRYQNKDGSLTSSGKKRYEKNQLKEAKREYKTTVEEVSRSLGSRYGMKAIAKAKSAEKKINQAEQDLIKAKAQYAKNTKGEKAEFNAYRKEMQKSGLAGSAMDAQKKGRSTKIYNQLVKDKGRDYADQVSKSVQNLAVAKFAVGTTLSIGASFVSGYLTMKKLLY